MFYVITIVVIGGLMKLMADHPVIACSQDRGLISHAAPAISRA
jgi:hypothetical protein